MSDELYPIAIERVPHKSERLLDPYDYKLQCVCGKDVYIEGPGRYRCQNCFRRWRIFEPKQYYAVRENNNG